MVAPSAEGEAEATDARPVLDVPVYDQLLARPKGTRRSLGGAVGEQDRDCLGDGEGGEVGGWPGWVSSSAQRPPSAASPRSSPAASAAGKRAFRRRPPASCPRFTRAKSSG